MAKWKEVKKYARIYYRLEEILAEKDDIKELEKEGYGKDGLYQITRPPLEYKLLRMINILKEEGIEKEEMVGFIMQSSKGQVNPKIVKEMLDKI